MSRKNSKRCLLSFMLVLMMILTSFPLISISAVDEAPTYTDLVVSNVSTVSATAYDGDRSKLVAKISNNGTKDAPAGAQVDFYFNNILFQQVVCKKEIPADGFVNVSTTIKRGFIVGAGLVTAIVNSDVTVAENRLIPENNYANNALKSRFVISDEDNPNPALPDEIVIINQAYGGNGKSDTPFSHSFVELYNAGGDSVNLSGYRLVATNANDVTSTLELAGTISARSSYLVRGKEETAKAVSPVYTLTVFDQDWDVAIDNKIFNVTLEKETDTEGEYEAVDSVSAISADTDTPVKAGEGDPVVGISKQKSVRRIDFKDTDSNADDFEVLKFEAADQDFIDIYRPRSLADKAWENYFEVIIPEDPKDPESDRYDIFVDGEFANGGSVLEDSGTIITEDGYLLGGEKVNNGVAGESGWFQIAIDDSESSDAFEAHDFLVIVGSPAILSEGAQGASGAYEGGTIEFGENSYSFESLGAKKMGMAPVYATYVLDITDISFDKAWMSLVNCNNGYSVKEMYLTNEVPDIENEVLIYDIFADGEFKHGGALAGESGTIINENGNLFGGEGLNDGEAGEGFLKFAINNQWNPAIYRELEYFVITGKIVDMEDSDGAYDGGTINFGKDDYPYNFEDLGAQPIGLTEDTYYLDISSVGDDTMDNVWVALTNCDPGYEISYMGLTNVKPGEDEKDPDPDKDPIIINSVFGGGLKGETPFSNSYIELYNTSDEDVDLSDYTISYVSSRPAISESDQQPNPATTEGEVVSVELEGIIPAHTSFLIIGKEEADARVILTASDFDWDIAIDNKQYNITLKKDEVVVDSVTAIETADLVEVAGEGNPVINISKHKPIVRANFVDTNDNASDFKVVSLKDKAITVVEDNVPHSLVDGAWGNVVLAQNNNMFSAVSF